MMVQRSQAGSRIACSSCQQLLDVPTIRGLSQLEAIESSESSSQRAALPSRVNRRWTPLRGSVAACCFLVALVGLGRSGLYAGFRYFYPTVFSEEAMLAEAHALATSYSPVETWDTWRYLHRSGLGSKQPPVELIEKRAFARQDQSMRRWALAGGVGLLGLLATMLVGKR